MSVKLEQDKKSLSSGNCQAGFVQDAAVCTVARTRTGCINLALKGHGFSRAVKAAKTLGFSP
jgi:hypothetical protein